MIPTIFCKSFCCTPLFGKSEHGKVYPERKKKVGFCFPALPKARLCIAFWTVSPTDLLRTSCHWRIKARPQWGSASSKEMAMCGQYGRNRVEEDKWDRSRCKIAAYLSFKEDARTTVSKAYQESWNVLCSVGILQRSAAPNCLQKS